MKKSASPQPGKAVPEEDDDYTIPEFDFANATPATYWKKLQKGADVFINDAPYVVGAGRVLVRVDTANPALFAAKLELANQIYEVFAENRWSVTQFATALQTSRPKAKLLLFGELGRFSVDQLVGWLRTLGYETRIKVDLSKRKSPKAKPLARRAAGEKRARPSAHSVIA